MKIKQKIIHRENGQVINCNVIAKMIKKSRNLQIVIELTQGDILQLHMTITYNHKSTDYILNFFFSPKFHDRSKHNNIKYHFLCEKVNNQILQLEFIGPAQAQTSSMCCYSWTYRLQ